MSAACNRQRMSIYNAYYVPITCARVWRREFHIRTLDVWQRWYTSVRREQKSRTYDCTDTHTAER
jgi:hypothetical protein